MKWVCEDCGTEMRERDVQVVGKRRRVLSWECDHCGNVEVDTPAARHIRAEITAGGKTAPKKRSLAKAAG